MKHFSLYTNDWCYNEQLLDRYGRDRYYHSLNQDIFNPTLSKEIIRNGLQVSYPKNKKFAVCISHDIDHLFLKQTTARKMLNSAKHLLGGRIANASSSFQSLFQEKIALQYSLDTLKKVNDEFDIISSYYILSLSKNDEDYNYDVLAITDQLQSILANGNEIGLHGGHKAYNEIEQLLIEKKRLENCLGFPVKGYRNHYLRFQLPLSWRNLESAGFFYDTTFGYADCAGFRNGMCFPFYPYDNIKKEFLKIIEIPLIMMDATLFYYMRLDEDASLKLCKKILSEIIQCNGVFTLLWHNNFLVGEMGRTYKKILELLASMDPWFTTTTQLAEWWQNQGILEKSQAIVQKLLFKE